MYVYSRWFHVVLEKNVYHFQEKFKCATNDYFDKIPPKSINLTMIFNNYSIDYLTTSAVVSICLQMRVLAS